MLQIAVLTKVWCKESNCYSDVYSGEVDSFQICLLDLDFPCIIDAPLLGGGSYVD
jgi:hypothetical protein